MYPFVFQIFETNSIDTVKHSLQKNLSMQQCNRSLYQFVIFYVDIEQRSSYIHLKILSLIILKGYSFTDHMCSYFPNLNTVVLEDCKLLPLNLLPHSRTTSRTQLLTILGVFPCCQHTNKGCLYIQLLGNHHTRLLLPVLHMHFLCTCFNPPLTICKHTQLTNAHQVEGLVMPIPPSQI